MQQSQRHCPLYYSSLLELCTHFTHNATHLLTVLFVIWVCFVSDH